MGTSESRDQADVEQFADALMDAIEDDIGGDAAPDVLRSAAFAFRKLGIEFVRRYNRLEIMAKQGSLTEPVLFVANHGFGGIFDLNVFAVGAALDHLQLDRPVTILTHQLAWTLGVGPLIEPLGARPASRQSAEEAFARGEHVAVFPGGDVDAAKSWEDRNRIVFDGRVVPMVTAGAGESLFVVSSGERLARALRLDKLLRVKAAPISVSLPWGLSVGAVGMLPYLPLPSKLVTRVLAPLRATDGEDAAHFADRVHDAMQRTLDAMTAERTPLLG